MLCLCVPGDCSEGALAFYSAGGQRASAGLACCPTGETPLAAQHTDTKDTADTLAQGETRQTHTFINDAVLDFHGLKLMAHKVGHPFHRVDGFNLKFQYIDRNYIFYLPN